MLEVTRVLWCRSLFPTMQDVAMEMSRKGGTKAGFQPFYWDSVLSWGFRTCMRVDGILQLITGGKSSTFKRRGEPRCCRMQLLREQDSVI